MHAVIVAWSSLRRKIRKYFTKSRTRGTSNRHRSDDAALPDYAVASEVADREPSPEFIPNYEVIFGSLRQPDSETYFSYFRINDLPQELLAEVFLAYIIMVYDALHYNRPPRPYAWFSVRHVCRAWRATALSYPQLSSHIHIWTPECVRSMLRTSGASPLHIYDISRRFGEWREEAQHEIFGHMDRIVRLEVRLTFHPSSLGTQKTAAGTSERSGISTVKILLLRETPPGYYTDPIWPEYSFPHMQEFSGRASDMHLFIPLIPSTLRHLTLCDGFSKSTLDAFIALLSSLPQLTELNVMNMSYRENPPREIQRVLPSSKIATLEHLSQLAIAGHGYDVGVDLLRRLIYPSSTTVRQSYNFQLPRHPFYTPQIFDTFLAKFCPPDAIFPQSLSISSSGTNSLEVHLWPERLSPEDVRSEACHGISSCFTFTMKYTPQDAFLNDFLRRLPLSDVRVALLQELSPARFLWGDVFPLLVSLEHVYIEAEPPDSADEQWLADADVILGRPESIFPALTAATISHLARPTGSARRQSSPSALRILAYHLRTRPESFAQGRSVVVHMIQDDYQEAMSQPTGAIIPMRHSI